MISPRLKSVTIENFRSIKGRIEVPLDAAVVLVHAANGTGKTSLLTAIEVALTRQVTALERVDPGYQSHLLNHGADRGNILLEIEGLPGTPKALHVDVSRRGISHSGGVGVDAAKFFAERCYLAQVLLNQLLSIYQDAGADAQSPLSRFVHELLGLDKLDALDAGVQPAHDLRNARQLAPNYVWVENQIRQSNLELGRARTLRQELDRSVDERAAELRVACARLRVRFPRTDAERAGLRKSLGEEDIDAAFVNVVDARRQIQAMVRELDRHTSKSVSEAGSIHRQAAQALAEWRETHEERLVKSLRAIADFFNETESREILEDPKLALGEAVVRVQAEARRLAGMLDRNGPLDVRLQQLRDEEAAAQKAIVSLNERIGVLSKNAGALSVILAEIGQHIHDDNCPVCDHDFGAASRLPLSLHVTEKARTLATEADQLANLATERSAAQEKVAALRRERELLEGHVLPIDAVLGYSARLKALREFSAALQPLEGVAEEGTRLAAAERRARHDFVSAEGKDSALAMLGVTVDALRVALGQEATRPPEALAATLKRLEMFANAEETRLREREGFIRAAISAIDSLGKSVEERRPAIQAVSALEKTVRKLERGFRDAENLRGDLREFRTAVAATRYSITRRVFNDDLNRLWRDLFVRLAPMEAFVPAFHLPESAESSRFPKLETVHRGGEIGGTPGAMLSAGNLNTAALTLFLALHLSVVPRLPWLLLDDPVQSMDDVHITQFASLLRTLAKEHNRQILIAVHDRQLFEYLSLELSPAFEGDQLLTIDLGKTDKGVSWIDARRFEYETESALRPVAA